MLVVTSSILSTKKFRNSLAFLFLIAITVHVSGQVIWLENFSGAPPAPGWTQNFGTCGGGTAAVGVVGGRFQATNQDGTTCCLPNPPGGGDNNNDWTTNSIDITNYCNVTVSATFGGVGTFEDDYILTGPFFGCSGNLTDNSHDQMVFYYSLDGGPWVQFYYAHVGTASGPFPSGTAMINGLSGTSLRIQIKPACKATAETLWFDNVTVSGTLPVVNQPPNVTVCAGQTIATTFTGSAGATFTWTNDNTATGLAASGTGNINTPSAAVTTQQVSTVTVTPNIGVCIGLPKTFTVTVNPTLTVNDPADMSVCGGDPVSVLFTGTASTFSWTNSNPAIGLGATGTGDLSFNAASIATTQTGTITVTPGGPCPGPAQMFTITVSPAPTVNQPADVSACAGGMVNVNFTGTGGPAFSWTNSNPAIGLGASGTGNISFSSAAVAAQEVATITVTPQAGTCPGTPKTFTITINPVLTVDDPTDVAVCGGDPVAVSFTGTASTFSWTNSNPAIGLGASGTGNLNFNAANVATTQTGTITITPSGLCPGPAQTFTITVAPAPTVNQPADVSICAGGTVNVNFAGTGSPVFSWTNSNPAIGLGASGTGNISFSSAAVTTQEVATITVTPQAGTCPGTPKTFTITINPVLTVDDPTDMAVCGGDPVAVNFTGTASTFSWTNGNPAIGLGASGSGNLNFNAANVATIQTGTIMVTPSGTCPGPAQTFTITVSPAPTVNQPADVSACAGGIVNVNFAGTGSPVFSWTNSNPAIGLGTSGTGNVSFTSTAVTAQEVATITVTPQAGTCPGTPKTFTITINPVLTVDDPADVAVCGSNPVAVNFTGTASNFSWTNSNPAIGLGASGTGNLNFNAASVGITQTGTITVTPGGPCPGPAQTFTITVAPAPTVNQPADVSVCAGGTVNVNFAGTGGPVFSWTNSNPAIGLGASGTGNISFSSAAVTAQEVATITITPQAGTCPGMPKTFTITVNPVLTVDDPADVAVCGGDPVTVNFTGTASTFSWTNSNPAIGLGASGTGNLNFTAGATVQSATITVTPGGTCPGLFQNFTVTVAPAPTVSQLSNVAVCAGSPVNVNFTGTGGATFSWTNSNPGIGLAALGSGDISFNSATVAVQTVATITVTPQVGSCMGPPKTFTITLNPSVIIDDPADVAVCSGDPVNVHFTGTATTYSWTNSNPAIGLPASGTGDIGFTAGTTNQTALITVTTNGPCSSMQTFTIDVASSPAVDQPADLTACGGNQVTINFTGTAGVTYAWTNSNPSIGLGSNGTGDLDFAAAAVAVSTVATITVTPQIGTCTGTPRTFTITVNPGSSVTQPANVTACDGELVTVNFTGTGSPTFNWTNSNPAIGLAASGSGNLNFVAAGAATTQTATITVSPGGPCPGPAKTFTIMIPPAPTATQPANASVCGGAAVNVPFTGTATSYTWTNSNPGIGLPASGTGNLNFNAATVGTVQTATITVTPKTGFCAGITVTFTITVNPGPAVSQPANVSACGSTPVNVNFSGTSGATFSWTNTNPAIGLGTSGTGNISFNSAAVASVQTANLSVTASLAGCTGTAMAFTITVNPTPVVNPVNDLSACGGQPVNVPLSGTGSPVLNWTNNNVAIGLAASGTGNINFTAANVAATQTGNIVVTPTANGCTGVPINFDINIVTSPTVNQPANVTACAQTIVNIPFTGTTGGMYSWTNSNPAIGLPASDMGNIGFTAANVATTQTATIMVTPQLGSCTGTPLSFTITINPSPTATITGNQTICNGASTSLTASGGSVFSWNTSAATASITVMPAATTTYTVTVSNGGSCTATATATVTVHSTSSVTVQQTSCDPTQVGSVTQTLLNQFGCDSIITIVTTLLAADTTNLAQLTCNPNNAGTFTQSLSNQFGCDSTVITVINFDPAARDTTILNLTSCDPSQVGSVQNLLTGSDGCDSLIITNTTLLPSNTINLIQTTCNPTNAGTFTQNLTNQFGCDSTVITMVTFDPAARDTTILNLTSCDASQVGSIQNLLTGSDGCDSLIITNTTLLSSNTTNLSGKTCNPANAGTFIQILSNQFGCDSTITTMVTFDPAARDTLVINLTSCDASQVGSVQNLLMGSDGCDSLVITNTALLPSITTNLSGKTCNPNNAGTFTQSLTNQFGCDSTVVTMVTFDPNARDTMIINLTSCDPSQVGSVQNLLTGSDGCDSLVITNTSLLPSSATNISSKTCNPINAGTFFQILSNQFGCDSTVITMVTFDPAAADTTILTHTTCDLTQVGSVQTLFTGVDGCDSLVITNTIIDAAQCGVVVAISTTDISCADRADGQASLTVSTGQTPLTYQWTDGAGNTGNGQIDDLNAPTIINGLSPGTFTATITSAIGVVTIINANVASPAPVLVQTTAVQAFNGFAISCAGALDGSAQASATGGTSPYQFDWGNGTDLPVISGLGAGTYPLTVTDQQGCTAEGSVDLTQPAPVSLAVQLAAGHCGAALIEANISAAGGVEPYILFIDSVGTADLHPDIALGTHTLQLSDVNGCTADTTVKVDLPTAPQISLPADTLVHLGESLTIEAITNLTSWQSVRWQPIVNDSCCADSLVQTWAPLHPQRYTVTIVDDFGCSASASILVRVERKTQLYVPNVISPNDDGHNDYFQISAGSSVVELSELQVYDRWGEMVYHLEEPVPAAVLGDWTGWDGKMGSRKAALGVYVYYLKIRLINGETEVIKGDVTVIKR